MTSLWFEFAAYPAPQPFSKPFFNPVELPLSRRGLAFTASFQYAVDEVPP
jgi:hypothetical protein